MRPAPAAELLLGRPECAGDLRQAAASVTGRRVLITGAAGSIGAPLAELVVAAQPERLVLLDHHEYSLFSLERSLGPASPRLWYEFADIRDAPHMEAIFREHRPDLVVHLAAAKHVPYGQRFPEGAVRSNVLSTAHLLELGQQMDVQTLVYPSSDKSVDPPSLYGATKRIAEALVQTRADGRRWSVVRFVNIIGTRGSVIETFRQQLLADRPLTVTDEHMTRYWISMDEALWCLLMAGQCAPSGGVVMPACGEPIPLLETARRLASLDRPDRVPYPIVCTGIRPGERLHEVLLSDRERFEPGPAVGLRLVARTSPAPGTRHMSTLIQDLHQRVETADRDGLIERCMQAARDLQ